MPSAQQSMIISEFDSPEINNATIGMVGAGGLSLAGAPLGASASVAPTQKPPTKCARGCRVFRKVISFLLSHIGLLSLVVGYCIMGGFVFKELERENELMVKRNMTKNRLSVTDDLWAITKKRRVLKKEEWTADATTELRNFEQEILRNMKQKGWDGIESEETVTWSFSGGLFYSITVITTIGYGHIAPKTPIAKIVTIFYAILGIPLTVLCWSNIGDAMANSFRFCYWRICCYVCTKKPKKRKRRATSRRGTSVRHSRARSIRRSHRTSRSADTISDSLNSYSISDPDRFFDDGGTVADIQSFNTQIGTDGVPISASGTSRGLFHRNRPSKRSLPGRSSSQGSSLQTSAIPSSNLMNSNPPMQQLSTLSAQQQTLVTQNNHTSYANQDCNALLSNQNSVQPPPSMNGIHVSPDLSSNLNDTSYPNTQNDTLQTLPSENTPNTTIYSDTKDTGSAPASTSAATKKEAKKENKKMSAFAVSKIGMKLKEKAQKTQKNSSASPLSTKDQIISTKNGIQQNNEMPSTSYIGASETANNSTPSSINPSSASPLIKIPAAVNPTGSIISVPNRGTRPFSNLIISSTAPTTQLAGSPASPIVSTVVGPRTPSVHQQSSQVLQTQSSSMSHQFGGNIGLQQPPTLRLERARPNEENEWLEDPYYYEEYISEEDEEGEDYSTKNVPIWLSILLVLVYIGFGAYLFREWEDWSWLDSSYFCFITLTTIGFGDMVPDQKDTDGEVRIALTSLYLLFGIAMICMSFNLVQVQVINNVKNMGKQLGIIKDDRDDDDY